MADGWNLWMAYAICEVTALPSASGLVKAGGALAWGAINVLEIVFANEIFSLNMGSMGESLRIEDSASATLGAIFFVTGLGTGLGPIVMRRILGDRPRRVMFGISVGFGLLALGIFGIEPCADAAALFVGNLDAHCWVRNDLGLFGRAAADDCA